MRTTVRLDDELLRRAKVRAAKDGTTLTALIEQGLRAVLGGESAGQSRGVREEAASFERDAKGRSGAEILAALPKDHGSSLLDNPEYMRLAEKAGSLLPSRILAVMDEEADLTTLKGQSGSTGG